MLSITIPDSIEDLKNTLSPLIGTRIEYVQLPLDILPSIEPSQIGTIVGTVVDAVLPRIALAKNIGLQKATFNRVGERECYPDFQHETGYRLELKGAFRSSGVLKKTGEPSARLSQKVTVKNIDPNRDALLVVVYELQQVPGKDVVCPVIVDLGIFPVVECVNARDKRMLDMKGKWFGDYETPTILSKIGKKKLARGEALNETTYGRKEGEGQDFNEDTNFGKLRRIPYTPLQKFLSDCGLAARAV